MTRTNIAMMLLGVLSASAAVAAKPTDTADREKLASFAQCIVDKKPDTAAKAVAEDWDSDDLKSFENRLLAPGCVGTVQRGITAKLKMAPGLLKAAIAEQLIRREKRDPAVSFQAIPPLVYREPWPVATEDSKTGKPLPPEAIAAQQNAVAIKNEAIVGQKVGECVARMQPAGVRAVFDTGLGSDEEMEALRGLTPQLTACVQKGQTIQFNRTSLRSLLALGYYRLSVAAPTEIQTGVAQ